MRADLWNNMIRLLFAMLLLPSISLAQPLDVLYFEYPPYYHALPDGRATGLIVDLANRVFDKAGARPNFASSR